MYIDYRRDGAQRVFARGLFIIDEGFGKRFPVFLTAEEIERRLRQLHLERPEHLRGLDGSNICHLFQRWRSGDRAALRLFAEYNLSDVIHLRTLAAYAYNQLGAAAAARAPALRARWQPVAVPGRGDVLYDVSKLLLRL